MGITFYLGLSFILLHEMDAVDKKEWRIFPGLARLSDEWGYKIFVLAHLPLYIRAIASKAANTRCGQGQPFAIRAVASRTPLPLPKRQSQNYSNF